MTSSYLFEPYAEVYNLFISSFNYVIYCSQPSINKKSFCLASVVVIQSLSHIWFFATPWTAGRQATCPSPSPRICLNSSIGSMMPFNHLILCYPFLLLPSVLPSIRMSQLFLSDGQSIGASASASVLPMNIQDWFHLGLTGLIFLLSKGL